MYVDGGMEGENYLGGQAKDYPVIIISIVGRRLGTGGLDIGGGSKIAAQPWRIL